MKRKDLEVGKRYATEDGKCYEVAGLTPGVVVREGDWTQDPHLGQRFMAGRGTVPYQTNAKIAVWYHAPDGARKATIEPRLLVKPWEEFDKERRAGEWATARRERVACNLTAAAQRRGMRGLHIDMGTRTATISVEDLGAFLEIEV